MSADYKIRDEKLQYSINREAAKKSALSSVKDTLKAFGDFKNKQQNCTK